MQTSLQHHALVYRFAQKKRHLLENRCACLVQFWPRQDGRQPYSSERAEKAKGATEQNDVPDGDFASLASGRRLFICWFNTWFVLSGLGPEGALCSQFPYTNIVQGPYQRIWRL